MTSAATAGGPARLRFARQKVPFVQACQGREPGDLDGDVSPFPPGFAWGEPADIGSAAFWVAQCSPESLPALRLARTLRDEVIGCLLGGYGIPGDVGVAAFERLRDRGLLDGRVDEADLVVALREPLSMPGRHRPIRYRFATQRAQRVAAAARVLDSQEPPSEPRACRDWLINNVPGVGPKTASWVVRNVFPGARVAVVDIHVHRVGLGACFFDWSWTLPRDYRQFEEAFLAIADIGGVDPGVLDHTIWSTMASVSLPTRAMICRFSLDPSSGPQTNSRSDAPFAGSGHR